MISKAWENTALEFGILVCFASFHFTFQLAGNHVGSQTPKHCQAAFHRPLLQAGMLAKWNKKSQQNRKARKRSGKPYFSPPQVTLPKGSTDSLHFSFSFILSDFSTILT